jgi:SAM-dependent methyltransferase
MARTSIAWRRVVGGDLDRPAAPRGTARRAFARLFAAVRHILGVPLPILSEDLRILEQVIFGYYAAHAPTHSLLLVGGRSHTQRYERSYFAGRDFWTLGPREHARRSGARQHVVAPLEQLGDFFPEGYFDLIVCNGIYGHGLDSPEQCEAAFGHCYTRLRPGGHLVLGWDDVPARTPVALENVRSLRGFRKLIFPPLGTSRYLTDTAYRHTFDFYCR